MPQWRTYGIDFNAFNLILVWSFMYPMSALLGMVVVLAPLCFIGCLFGCQFLVMVVKELRQSFFPSCYWMLYVFCFGCIYGFKCSWLSIEWFFICGFWNSSLILVCGSIYVRKIIS